MSFLKYPVTLCLLSPALALVGSPVPAPSAAGTAQALEKSKAPTPDLKHLKGELNAQTIQKIAEFHCEMTETQASITQSISTYLSSRDEESYTASQSRIDDLTILTIHAKGMTKKRAESLVADIPHDRILRYGWDKVILANDTEGWIFDMAPSSGSKPNQ